MAVDAVARAVGGVAMAVGGVARAGGGADIDVEPEVVTEWNYFTYSSQAL